MGGYWGGLVTYNPGLVNVALKEWQLVIDAMAAGRQIFLLRKGGIAEGKRGFEPKHREFVFFPTWEHQHSEMVKPEFAAAASADLTREDQLTVRHYAVVDAVEAAPRERAVLLDAANEYIWNERYVQMRYDYRPDLPLYMLVIRLYVLPAPVTIARDRRYAGCRSWVMLYENVPTDGALPALDDDAFARKRQALFDALAIQPPQ